MNIRLRLLITLLLSACAAMAQDSISAVASHHYEHPFFLEKILVGKNYRRIWAMPVHVPVFHAGREKGGLIPKEMGGGMQTKSLHLEDKSGRKWVLRSVDKTVDKAMQAQGIRNSYIRKFSQQMISAAQPYGPLTLKPMAEAIGVLNIQSEMFYVPDDPALGEYRSIFANSMCLLELEQPVFHRGDKVLSTDKLLRHLDKDYHLDEKMMLQARLLDMLVGDWDRHGDQWKWEVHRQADGSKVVYPIPRDHDQTYFNSTGLVFNIVRLFNMHTFVGFRRSLKLTALNYKEWSFDKTMMKHLSEADWRDGVQAFVSKLTDEILATAVRQLPTEVYETRGDKLLRTLKARRDKMPDAVMHYYHFLQTHPEKVAKAAADMKHREVVAKKLKEAAEKDDDPE